MGVRRTLGGRDGARAERLLSPIAAPTLRHALPSELDPGLPGGSGKMTA
jgi:hypothetical protein